MGRHRLTTLVCEIPRIRLAIHVPTRTRRGVAKHSFPALDGVRAIAALSVVTYHAAEDRGTISHGYLGDILNQFSGGVAIFYMLSGFLLFLPFVRDQRDGVRRVSVVAYFRRRLVRIAPAYWIALTALAIWPGVRGDVLGSNWWRFYGFAQLYGRQTIYEGLGQAWTLCVEILFYAALPVLALVLTRVVSTEPPRRWVASQLLAMVALAVLVILVAFGVEAVGYASVGEHTWLGSVLGSLTCFFPGMLLATVVAARERNPTAAQAVGGLASRRYLCWSAAVILIALDAASAPLRSGALDPVAVVLIIMPVTIAPDCHEPRGLLTHPVMVWLGTVSYGIYLWHKPFVDYVAAHVPFTTIGAVGDIAVLGCTLTPVLIVATASYYLVEKPMIDANNARLRAARRESTA